MTAGPRAPQAMKKILLLVLAAVLIYGFLHYRGTVLPPESAIETGADAILQAAYESRQSNLQVQGQGTVVKVLPDDRDGSRHQRFILALRSGQTLLIAHNIDLAPRIPHLAAGDEIAFHGEFEWNAKGGVIHWTHHDPDGRHPGGWLEHEGRTYQ